MPLLFAIKTLLEFQRTHQESTRALVDFVAKETLREFSVLSMFLGLVRSNGAIHYPFSTGHNSHIVRQNPERFLDEHTPGHAVFVDAKIMELGDIDEYPFYHPENIPVLFPEGFQSSIAFPVPKFGAAFIFCSKKIELDGATRDLLMSVGEIFSISLSHGNHGAKFDVDGSHPAPINLLPLTPRQWSIRDAMLRGLTNGEIAREINFSESLIRHETIRIYSKLGITGRKELFALESKGITTPLSAEVS